jgi:hypothetical protein
MITIDNNSFKLPSYYIFLEDIKYMTILTRQERERLVLDLYYNQGKTYREISKEARISPRDIGVILNKVIESKAGEWKEERQQDNNIDAEKNQELEQHLSLSAQAYKLFSEGKTPLEVAIALNLRESEATRFCREYWKLKQIYNLNMVYEETKDDIASFLKLYKLSKDKGIGVQQVVDTLAIANNDLPAIEERFKSLRNDVGMLQSQKHTCKRNLYQLNNQIATTSRLLNSLRISCERERRKVENLYNEKAKLEATITEFKNNNEEYLDKIKQVAYEEVKSVLTSHKLLLRFTTASVIESLRSNSELCKFVINDDSNNNTTIIYGPKYPSLMLSGQQQQQQSFNDSYTAVILEEAEKLYNELITELTNRTMAATAAAIKTTSSISLPDNNQPEIYNNDRSIK